MQWTIAGAKATQAQLRNAGFDFVERWGVPETLESGENDREERDDDFPWTFFAAELDT